ncbi:MAG: hypothetical protein ABR582_02590 [Gemmatimonadaceae bacterium]
MRSRTPWSSEELLQLEELARRNYSLQVIALKLGRSAAAVDAKATQLKIAMRRMKRNYTRKPHGESPKGRESSIGHNSGAHEGLESA